MAIDQSSTPAGGSNVEAILTAGVETLSSAQSVVELSRQLDLTAVEKIERIVQATMIAGEPERAEAILLATERAAWQVDQPDESNKRQKQSTTS